MTDDKQEKPLYLGHRERLRARFLADDGASMPDYEVLELLLTMSIPRRDVKPLAKKLVAQYGDIGGVLHAPAHELIDVCGLSVNTLALLKVVATCALRSSSACFSDSDQPIIAYWDQFEDYCRQLMAYNEVEEFRVFFFDDVLHYKGSKLMNTGTVNKTMAHPRESIKAALDNKAVIIILAHNHPSGECKPSAADKQLTEEIRMVAEAMDIEVYDHLIVTRNEIFSFRNSGLILPQRRKI